MYHEGTRITHRKLTPRKVSDKKPEIDYPAKTKIISRKQTLKKTRINNRNQILHKDQDHKPETDSPTRTRIINRKQILKRNQDHRYCTPETDRLPKTRIILRKLIFPGIAQHFSILHRNGKLTV